MKKAFDQNVSRAKPRLRLGAAFTEGSSGDLHTSETVAEQVIRTQPVPSPALEGDGLSSQVRARAEKGRIPRPTAAEAMQRALEVEERLEAEGSEDQRRGSLKSPLPIARRSGIAASGGPPPSKGQQRGAGAAAPIVARAQPVHERAPAVEARIEPAQAELEEQIEAAAEARASHVEPHGRSASRESIKPETHADPRSSQGRREPEEGSPAPEEVAQTPELASRGQAEVESLSPSRGQIEIEDRSPELASRGQIESEARDDAEPEARGYHPPESASAELDTGEVFAARGQTVAMNTAQRIGAEAPRSSGAATGEPQSRHRQPVAQALVNEEGRMKSHRSASTTAHAEPLPSMTEVQTPVRELEAAPELRRERLKERLKAVRENPRPEPLPATVAEAGVMAVERISTIQVELLKVKAVNLALAQDLEGARRQAERATEEARLRMDEARRLSTEMEGRAKLLTDLERELSSLEGERDEALLSLQESRQALEASGKEKLALEAEVAKRDQSLADSLSEEERLAAELEAAYDAATGLRRSVDALHSERDTLARQVADLTRERAELLEARKALESVHRALSQAVAR